MLFRVWWEYVRGSLRWDAKARGFRTSMAVRNVFSLTETSNVDVSVFELLLMKSLGLHEEYSRRFREEAPRRAMASEEGGGSLEAQQE